MKFKNLFLLLFLTITAISCKEEGKDKEGSAQGQEEIAPASNAFKVTLNMVTKKNDDFCLLYTEDGSLNFEKGVWKVIKGSESDQLVEFYLPNDEFPTQLRLDLGRNPEQDDILIKSIKFEYLGNTRELKGAEIGVFFRADANKCTFDPVTGLVKALVKDGKKETPSLYPHESVFAAELPKLAK
jgi:hypothetical protein